MRKWAVPRCLQALCAALLLGESPPALPATVTQAGADDSLAAQARQLVLGAAGAAPAVSAGHSAETADSAGSLSDGA